MHCALRARVRALEGELATAAAAAGALSAPPEGPCYRLGGDDGNDRLAQVLPGGRDFVLCQPGAAWAGTRAMSQQLIPANPWAEVTAAARAAAAPVCTPLHGRPLEADPMFDPGQAVVCAASMSRALAAAHDLRTVRDRSCIDVGLAA